MTTETTTTPTTDEIREYVASQVESIKDEALRAREESRRETEEQVQRFKELSDELETKRQRLSEAEAEYETLPAEAYRASLRGDEKEEARLRVRYRTVCDDLPALRSRISHLESECATYYSKNRADREGVAEAVRFQARTRPLSDEPSTRKKLLSLRLELDKTIEAAAWELAPDTAAAVVGARDLEANREEATRIIRRS